MNHQSQQIVDALEYFDEGSEDDYVLATTDIGSSCAKVFVVVKEITGELSRLYHDKRRSDDAKVLRINSVSRQETCQF